MANRFMGSDNTQGNNQNLFTQWNTFQQNPVQFLSNRGINIPQEYQSSPEMMAKYLLSQMNGDQQNFVMQKVNMLKGMFGMR